MLKLLRAQCPCGVQRVCSTWNVAYQLITYAARVRCIGVMRVSALYGYMYITLRACDGLRCLPAAADCY
jgi:hypothetical protein